jgi:hypothetical protein
MINKIVKKEFYIFIVLLEIIIMLMGLLTSFSFSKYLFKEEFVAFKIQDEIQNENTQMKNNIENKAKEKVEVEADKDDIPSLIEIVTIKH